MALLRKWSRWTTSGEGFSYAEGHRFVLWDLLNVSFSLGVCNSRHDQFVKWYRFGRSLLLRCWNFLGGGDRSALRVKFVE